MKYKLGNPPQTKEEWEELCEEIDKTLREQFTLTSHEIILNEQDEAIAKSILSKL